MIRFLFPSGPLHRRDWLRVGGLGLLGLDRLRRAPATAPRATPGFGRARSVILVVASGGQSQFETWDPKPDAPVEIRGAFQSIPTSIPGVRVCEHLPLLAKLADHCTIVRSVSHDDLDHGSALYLTLTGRFHPRKSSNPPPAPSDFPVLGAVVKCLRPAPAGSHAAVHVNGPVFAPELPAPGQYGGLLGRGAEPLVVGDPTTAATLLQGMEPPPEVPRVRLQARQSLLRAIDSATAGWAQDRLLLERDSLTRQAFDLLASPEGRRAFDLDQEPPRIRDRYGRTRGGQGCLLARRLVEAGVPLVTVFFNHGIRGQDKHPGQTAEYGWDTHNDIFEAMKDHLLPPFDRGVSALLGDLEQRGLLATTLVVCLGEFGRAPKVALEPNFAGASPGRKHWAAVYSVLLAGAGVKRGAVYGASDRIGAYPQERPVTPADLAATVLAGLGLDPSAHYQDSLARPFPASVGRPIVGLYEG